MNRRPYLALFDLKEKCARYVGVSTKETDLFDRHDHHTGKNKVEYYRKYSQSLVLFVGQTQMAKIRRMRIPLNLE